MNFSDTEFDIIIQAGQSNAEGFGKGPVAEEIMPKLTENIYQLEALKIAEELPEAVKVTYEDKPFVIDLAKEQISTENEPLGNFALSFAEEYERNGYLEEGRKILIIRGAVGGTGFKKGHWGQGRQLYVKLLEMIDYALSLNKGNKVVAFAWHQGEHDAAEKSEPEIYKQQLKAMVEEIREKYGKGIPFIAGDFANEWKSQNLMDCEPIIAKLKEIIEEVGRADFVETADLLSNNQKIGNGDGIHFCRESSYIMGRRYFAKFQKIIGGENIEEN